MTEVKSARAEVLARIRSATGSPKVSPSSDPWQTIPRKYRVHGSLDAAGRIALLEERLRDYGAGVHRVAATQVASAVASVLRGRNKQHMLRPLDIEPSWLPDGFSFLPDCSLSHEQLNASDGVLTGCTLAIALTGTLVLCHGAASAPQSAAGRRALTLVPDYHLCVVQLSSVVETVPEAMHLLQPHSRQPITFISGPSATADIEMTRIQGVHGPRVLEVLLAG